MYLNKPISSLLVIVIYSLLNASAMSQTSKVACTFVDLPKINHLQKVEAKRLLERAKFVVIDIKSNPEGLGCTENASNETVFAHTYMSEMKACFGALIHIIWTNKVIGPHIDLKNFEGKTISATQAKLRKLGVEYKNRPNVTTNIIEVKEGCLQHPPETKYSPVKRVTSDGSGIYDSCKAYIFYDQIDYRIKGHVC